MDTFASVWDAADDVAADQSLRSLTSARMQVAPVWSFLAAASDDKDFSNRLALHEDRLHAAASAHGVPVEDLAKSLVDDYRTLKAEAAFYVEDGGDKVGGPYDTKADAQDAIDGGDVSGSNLKVEQDGDDDGETNEDGDDADDSDDAPSAKDSDDSDDDDSDGGNPFAKKEAAGSPRDLSTVDFKTNRERPDADHPQRQSYLHHVEQGHQDAISGSVKPHEANDEAAKRGTHGETGYLDGYAMGHGVGRVASLAERTAALFPVIAVGTHSVVHQPGETVFVDHFMGHDEHEGRKGVWASVVASPGQHGHEDRADSHLLKPMAPGGTPFFHHFGGLQKKAMDYNMAREEHHYEFGDERFRTGVGSYPEPDQNHGDPGNPWRPHRVYDSINSAQNHLSDGPFQGSPDRDEHKHLVEQHSANLRYYNHCNSCDHVYTPHHPDHVTHGAKDQCPNCGDTDFHESVPDVLHDSGTYAHSSQRHHFDDHDGAGEAHSEDNYGDPYGKMDDYRQRREGSRKTALEDGVDPLQFVLMASPQGEGTAEKEAHHDEATTVRTAAVLVGLYSDLVNDLSAE